MEFTKSTVVRAIEWRLDSQLDTTVVPLITARRLPLAARQVTSQMLYNTADAVTAVRSL